MKEWGTGSITFTVTLYLFFPFSLYVRKAEHRSDCRGEYQCIWRYILLSRANKKKKSKCTVKFIKPSSSCIFIIKLVFFLCHFFKKHFSEFFFAYSNGPWVHRFEQDIVLVSRIIQISDWGTHAGRYFKLLLDSRLAGTAYSEGSEWTQMAGAQDEGWGWQGDNYIHVTVSEKVRLRQDQDRVQGGEIFMLETDWYQVLG